MPGLTFSNQGGGTRRPWLWIVPVVLIVVSIVLITVATRAGTGGFFSATRSGIQTATRPLASLCQFVATPFNSLNTALDTPTYDEEDLSSLEQENEQLRALVTELEEYRQQNQRLISLFNFSDLYGLETVPATITLTTSGWDRTATIDKGSADGISQGMGVMSSNGLYGQVETVTPSTSTVRLINDANSSVAAMVQGTRATGILSGSYDGTLTLDYISVDEAVGVGDYIISSGEGGVYPQGILIGVASAIEVDPSKLYYSITVTPVSDFAFCREVLVLTGDETEVDSLIDEDMIDSMTSALIGSESTEADTESATGGSSGSTSSTATTDTDSSSDESVPYHYVSPYEDEDSTDTAEANGSDEP